LLAFGFWLLAVGFWLLALGYWLFDFYFLSSTFYLLPSTFYLYLLPSGKGIQFFVWSSWLWEVFAGRMFAVETLCKFVVLLLLRCCAPPGIFE